jgi:hypothetical protein
MDRFSAGKPDHKRPYSAPILTTYGDMAKLTASGTFGVSENMTSDMQKAFP